jgi:hypothetical protein
MKFVFFGLTALALLACDQRTANRDPGFDPGPPDASPPICDATLTLTPAELDFGRVVEGQQADQTFDVHNPGDCPVSFDALTLVGSPAFTVLIDGQDPRQDAAKLNDPDQDGSPGLSGGATATLTVRLNSTGTAARAGLRLHSSAVRTPLLVLPLRANLGRCLRVTPQAISFERVPVFEMGRETLTLEACGDQAVTLNEVTLDNDRGAFWLGGRPLQLEPGETVDFPVEFRPEVGGPHDGLVHLHSDDPEQPDLTVPLDAEGRANRCPTPRAVATEHHIAPLEVVTLDASPSTDPEGEIVAWRWTLIDAPEDSTTRPSEAYFDPLRPQAGGEADDPRTPQAQLWADLAGVYVLELQVTDRYGLVSPSEECPAEILRVEVIAEPQEDLHIQLVWHTPNDANESDEFGTDVDLHLLHPSAPGSWNSQRTDCYYGNQSPEWGPPGADGNPSLDIDDVDGAGPENTNLDHPENTDALGGIYRIGLHYYGSNGLGSSVATLRIFLAGVLAEELQRELLGDGHLWEAAGIEWSPQRHGVVPIDRYFRQIP